MIVPTNHSNSKSKIKKPYMIIGIILLFTSLILYSLKLTFVIFDHHFGYGFLCFLIAIGFISYSIDDRKRISGKEFDKAMGEGFVIRATEKKDDKES